MKKIIVIGLVLANMFAFAQVKKKAGTSAAAQPALKTSIDSLSYALGMSAGSFYKQQGMANLNTALCTKGVNDALKSNKTLLNEQQANAIIMAFMQKESAEKASGNKKAGAEFLAANKNK